MVGLLDRLEYLVNRRFPYAQYMNLAPSLTSGRQPAVRVTAEMREAVMAHRAELAALTAAELSERYDAERAKEADENRRKAEREEQERFFNQPWCNADIEHWSKAAHWSLDEAIALSFGKAPERVRWDTVQSLVNVSPFAFQYARRRDLGLRAATWGQLFDPVLPGIFLAWAKRTDISIPPGLIAAVEARGVQVADWKGLYEKSQVQWKARCGALEQLLEESKDGARANHDKWFELSEKQNVLIESLRNRIEVLQSLAPQAMPTTEKSLGTKERESLLKLVAGMAVGGYRFDPKLTRNTAVADITKDLETSGVALDADTVRKWLREASELLPMREQS